MNKKITYGLIIIIIAIIILLVTIWPDRIINHTPIVKDFNECVKSGYYIEETFPRKCKTPDGIIFVEDIGNILDKINLIKVTAPRPNQEVESPLIIEGEARGFWYFEASFPIKIFDGNGKLLGSTIAQAKSEWMTENFVPFSAELDFSFPATELGALVLEKDNPSGLPENSDDLRFPVYFQKVVSPKNIIKVNAYFNNDRLDPEYSCNKVFPVEREIIKTQAVARAALEELLNGPTAKEKFEGFGTSINPGVVIQSLTIDDGIAKVDFNEQLEFQVGGSCRVAAISAQIRETLKQFSTVKGVIISIDGRTEDILQP
jgi:hypothetical protein